MSHLLSPYFFLAELVTYVALSRWVPRVVAYYGKTYFDNLDAKPGRWWWFFGCMPACLFVGVAAFAYPPEALPFVALMVTALAGLTLADAKFQVIPDRFQIVGALGAVGFAATSVSGPLAPKLFSAGIGLAFVLLLYGLTRLYTLVRKRDALGLGDVKLLAWLALAFGPDTFFVLLYGLGLASVVAVPLVLLKRRTLQSFFAFGPFLALGAVVRLVEMSIGQ